MFASRTRVAAFTTTAALACALLAACGSAPQSSTSSAGGTDAKTATSVADFGGLDKLVEAAKKEGTLHTIALPPDWAN